MPVSISWFNKKMPPNKPIRSMQIKPFDSSRGRSSDLICEVGITHEKDSIPYKVILKCSQTGLLGRFKTSIRGAVREGLVYDSKLFNHSISPLNTPKLIFRDYSAIYSESVILIEDLRSNKYGFNAVDVFGSLKHPPKFSRNERKYLLDMIVQQLAAFHTKYWNSKELLQHSFLSGCGFYKDITDGLDSSSRNECKYNFSMFYTKTKWKKALKRLEKNKTEWLNKSSTDLNCENSMEFPIQISSKVIDYINEALEVSTYKLYLESIRKRPFSLCHADVHGDNIFISPKAKYKNLFEIKPNDLYYFDLQETGINDPGNSLLTHSLTHSLTHPLTHSLSLLVSDVANLFVVNCICRHGDSIADTLNLLHEVIRLYHDSVIKQGICNDYTYEQCLKSFYISVLEKFSWIFIIFCGEEEVYKLPIVQYIHNIVSFVIDSCGANHEPSPLRPMILT